VILRDIDKWCAIFGPVLFVSALKLFDPSLKIRGPAVVKQAKFIRDRKVLTISKNIFISFTFSKNHIKKIMT